MSIDLVKKELRSLADPGKAEQLQRFFKTGKGEYGEGDQFLGVSVPLQRKIAGRYNNLSLESLGSLLQENIHEYRLTAVFILVQLYGRQKEEHLQKEIVTFYLQHLDRINNWDLVDSSAHKILGPYYLNREKTVLYELVCTDHLWRQRAAIMSTFHFIRNRQFHDTLTMAELLLRHQHDLIHKAVGWMLREVGKLSMETEREFLDRRYKEMPRTMLRYAIEKFPETLRQQYLKGRI